jgi:O-antigen/teichoic acid export membrane protein
LAARETPGRKAARVAVAKEHLQEKVFGTLYQEARAAWKARPAPARVSVPSPITNGVLWLGGLYAAARALTFATQVAAGRWLGPAAYGKANLVVAASSYLQILPMLGFPLAVSKHMPEDAGPDAEARTVSTALLGFAVWGGAWLALALILRRPLAGWLRLPPDVFDSSLRLAFLTAAFTVFASPFLGGKAFAKRGAIEVAYAASAAAALGWLVASGNSGYETLINALCAALAVGAALSLFFVASSWKLRLAFDAARFKSLFSYALLGSLNLLSAAFLLAPGRLMLHHYRSALDIGVFSAYFTATIQITLALLTMAAAVVVPIASTPEGQLDLWRRLTRRGPALALAAAAVFAATTAAGIRVFGHQYPLRLEWTALFAVAGSLILLHGLIGALFSARNIPGLSISAAGNLLSGVANALLCRALVPSFGISGAAAALVVSYGLGMLFFAAAGLGEWAK